MDQYVQKNLLTQQKTFSSIDNTDGKKTGKPIGLALCHDRSTNLGSARPLVGSKFHHCWPPLKMSWHLHQEISGEKPQLNTTVKVSQGEKGGI